MKFKLRAMLILLIIFTECNGENYSNKAMPITIDNLKLYNQKKNKASQSVALGGSVMDNVIKIYKKPLDSMGYDFDKTILETTKVLKKTPNNSVYLFYAFNILNHVTQYVKMYPQESVNKGFVKVETRDKILSYLKYSEFNENIIQALKYVRECQQINNGICSAGQYSKILLDNKFIVPNIEDTNQDDEDTFRFRLTVMFDGKVRNGHEFGKYIEDENGNDINVNSLFEEDTNLFKLKDNAQEAINGYNPWWKK